MPEAAPAAPVSAPPSSPAPPAADKTAAAEPKSGKAGGAPFLIIGVAAGALALGAVVGLFVVSPRIVAARAEHTASHEVAASDEGKEGKGGHDSKVAVYRIENVIVNPAGSQGTRFLMASVAFELADPKVESRLRERDAQLRDAVTGLLESQTLEMLTRPGARDTLRRRLGGVVAPFTGGTPVQVYLPQLVIQ
jgi:flagellar FliL protein